jgi:hypothetical protein
MEGKNENRKTTKKCRLEVEEDLNIMRIKDKQLMVRDLRECGRISL